MLSDEMAITLDLLPGQRQMIYMPDKDVGMDFCCYQGGFGSGKTRGGVYLGLMLAEKNPGTVGLVCGMTWPLIRDTTLQTYFEVLDEWGYVVGRDYIWKASAKALVFPGWGNSTILFRSLDNPNKLKSLNLAWVHMEEMSECSEAAFLMLISRLRHKKMKRYRLFGTTNPQAKKGWIFKYFVEGSGLIEEEYDGDVVRLNYRRVMAPSTQNKFLSKANLLNMAKKFDPEYYRMNVLGEDGDYTAGLVVKNWSELNLEENEFKPALTLYLGCDFNVDPMAWELYQRYNGEYHYIDEISKRNTDIEECCEAFVDRYPPEDVRLLVITGDSSGHNRRVEGDKKKGRTSYKQMQNYLTAMGYPQSKIQVQVPHRQPNVVDRIRGWNALVCNSLGVRRIFANPDKCPWLVWNMHNLEYIPHTSIIWEPKPPDKEKNPDLIHYKHYFDAASYGPCIWDPIKLLTPPSGDPKLMMGAQHYRGNRFGR